MGRGKEARGDAELQEAGMREEEGGEEGGEGTEREFVVWKGRRVGGEEEGLSLTRARARGLPFAAPRRGRGLNVDLSAPVAARSASFVRA